MSSNGRPKLLILLHTITSEFFISMILVINAAFIFYCHNNYYCYFGYSRPVAVIFILSLSDVDSMINGVLAVVVVGAFIVAVVVVVVVAASIHIRLPLLMMSIVAIYDYFVLCYSRIRCCTSFISVSSIKN